MSDDHDEVDLTIELELIEPLKVPPHHAPLPTTRTYASFRPSMPSSAPLRLERLPSKPKSVAIHFLVGGAILLSVVATAIFFVTLASRVGLRQPNVVVTVPRDAQTDREEAREVFNNFTDAKWKATAAADPSIAAERAEIARLFEEIQSASDSQDVVAFRQLIDVDRMVKRIELTGGLRRFNFVDRRSLRNELKQSAEPADDWASIRLVGVRQPFDDANSRIVYAYCNTLSTGYGDESQYRFWIGRKDGRWLLYDWERLDHGLTIAEEWGVYCRYHETPVIENDHRWSALVNDSDRLSADGNYAEAKEKLRQAEVLACPAEFTDYHWILIASRWEALGESKEALRCFDNVLPAEDAPAAYLGRMDIYRWTEPDKALVEAEAYEAAMGTSPSILRTKARLYEELNSTVEAEVQWRRLLEMKPDDVVALTAYYRALPQGDKSKFWDCLSKSEDPVQVATVAAQSIGNSDYAALAQFSAYLARTAPDSPAAFFVAGLAKYYDGDYAGAADLYRRAFQAESDEAQRETYVSAYLDAMANQGQVVAAVERTPDVEKAFDSLFLKLDDYEISLSKAEHRALVEAYAQRYPEQFAAQDRLCNLALENNEYAVAERISRATLAKVSPPPAQSAGESSEDEQYDAPHDEHESVRQSLEMSLAAALLRQGKIDEAVAIGTKPRDTFAYLARTVVQERRWELAQQLFELRKSIDPLDPGLLYLQAELAARARKFNEAISHYRSIQELEDPGAGWDYICNERLPGLYIDAGQAIDYYRDAADKREAFGELAATMTQEKRWEALAELCKEHELEFSHDPAFHQVEADAAWEQEDYATVIRATTAALDARREMATYRYDEDRMKSLRIKAQLRLGHADEAAALAEECGKRDNNYRDLACVYALSGNFLFEAERLAQQTIQRHNNQQAFYHDGDAGHLFVSPTYRALQEQYPVELPYSLGPTIIGLTYDSPITIEATDVAAALQKVKIAGAAPEPLAALNPRVTRSFVIHLPNGSMWIASGRGRWDPASAVQDVVSRAGDSFNRSEGWVAIGIATWREAESKKLTALARRLALALAPEQPTAVILQQPISWRGLCVLPPDAVGLAIWEPTGRLDGFNVLAVEPSLADDHDGTLDARRVQQSLRSSVRKFETTPDARFEVWATVTEHPALDPLRLRVREVQRDGGSFVFEGTLENDSQLIPELKAGLPMRFLQGEVQAWKFNDDAPLFRNL